MAARGALELVHPVEAAGGDGVELAADVVAGAGEVEEEGDAVGATDEGILVSGAEVADEGGVAGADEILEEAVVREASLQCSVGEYQVSPLAVAVIASFCYHFLSLLVDSVGERERERDEM